MNKARTYNGIALGLGSLVLAGCASLQEPDTTTCMQSHSTRAIIFNTGGTKYNTDCNDGRAAFALLNRSGDPVGNALGFLLYMDQNKEAKSNLEERMGGKDNVKVAPETVAGLLTSPDNTSRYMGLQIYLYQPEKTRADVSTILQAEGHDPKTLLATVIAENAGNKDQNIDGIARDWAREHATAPMGVAATTCAQTPGCQRSISDTGVTYTFKKKQQPQ